MRGPDWAILIIYRTFTLAHPQYVHSSIMFCLKHGRIKKRKKKKKILCWQEKCHFRWGHWPKLQPKHRPLLFFSLNLTLLFLYSLYLCLTSPLSLFFHWPCLLLGLWVHFISSSLMLWRQFAETQYLFFPFFFKLGPLFPGWWNGGWCKDKDHRLFKHFNWSLHPHTSVTGNCY